MTDAEFYSLVQGDQFLREGKQYTVVKNQDQSQVAHPIGNPHLLIHFRPKQASQMTKVESQPAALAKAKSSHGFPLLERAALRLPQPHMSGQRTASVCVALDGGLTEARRGNEIGSPIPDALEFLADVTAAGIDVQISTHRPQNVVWDWLRVHCPGLENIVHGSPQLPQVGALYLSRYAYRISDDYPTVEELRELIHRSEDEKEPAVESAIGR